MQSNPWGVAVDQAGRVFVPDADHHRVAAYTPTGASLGELGGQGGDPIQIVPRQVAFARADRPSIYVLGGDGIVRVDFENTAPPPQGGGSDIDFISVLVIALLVAFIAFAILSRRGRRAASVGAALDGKVGLYAKNGAHGQDQQANGDQHRGVLHQAERKHQPAQKDDQAEDNAQTHQS